jgi:hypothetical protein
VLSMPHLTPIRQVKARQMCLFPIFSRGCALPRQRLPGQPILRTVKQDSLLSIEQELVKWEIIFGVVQGFHEIASADIGDRDRNRRGKIALSNTNCGLTGVQRRIEPWVGDGAETRFILDLESRRSIGG